jgi:hypothetical protein
VPPDIVKKLKLPPAITSWVLYIGSWLGFLFCFPGWLLGWISDRAMLGTTLALSWAALILEARNGVHITKDGK